MADVHAMRKKVPGMVLITVAGLYSVIPIISMLTAALAKQGTIPDGLSWPSDPQCTTSSTPGTSPT